MYINFVFVLSQPVFEMKFSKSSILLLVYMVLAGILSNECMGLYRSFNTQSAYVNSDHDHNIIQVIAESSCFGTDFIVKRDENKVSGIQLFLKDKSNLLNYCISEPVQTITSVLPSDDISLISFPNRIQGHFLSLQLTI